MHPVRFRRPGSALIAALVVLTASAAAQNAAAPVSAVDRTIRSEAFVTPPDPIASAVLAPRYLNVTLSDASPDGRSFLNEVGDGPVTMDRFSKPFHELGGLFVDFRANRDRVLTIRSNVGLEIVSGADGHRTTVAIPRGSRISNATWSPDGKSVAYYVHSDDATHIWVADAASGKARQLTRTPVLATLWTSFGWSKDSKRIVTVLVPDGRAAMPTPPAVPPGPRVKLAEESDKNRLRTYASLMSTPYDQELLEYHATGQLALIDAARGTVTKVGAPTMIDEVDLAPSGNHLLVTRMVKPFAYVVPVSSFGRIEEIWDLSGKALAQVDDRPLNLGVDTTRTPSAPGVGGGEGSARRREIVWRPDGQGLSFLEQEPARPGDTTAADAGAGTGNGNARNRRKDRLMQWLPPFDSGSAKVVFESDTRMSNHRFSPDAGTVFLSERTGQNQHEYAVILSDPTKKLTLARYRADDLYANPGSLILRGEPLPGGGGFGGGFGRRSNAGAIVEVSADGQSAYLYGTAYDKNPLAAGPRTFVDRVNIRNGQKTRIYESDNNNVYERVLAYQDLDTKKLVVSRESETDVPQSYLRDGDRLTQLTQNQDYTPDLTKAPKERFIVERPDGFKFLVNVTLPPGYQQGTRLPAMFWFYPREYAGQEVYDRGARTFN
ncbi:MAG: TolB family protein [Gemmatimonadales bacterium]